MIEDLKGNIIDEPLSWLNYAGLHLQSILPSSTVNNYITNNVCENKGKSTDKDEIRKFIEDYQIDWKDCIKCKNVKTIDECVKKFKTLNDFFIRKKKINIKPSETKIINPADSRVKYMKNKKKMEIKGHSYCISCMLKVSGKMKKYYENSHIIVSRLSPQDNHRFYSPVSGTIMDQYEIEGEFYSVHPIVRDRKNVYQKNYRHVLFIKTKNFGVVALCVIGATCIGSIKIHKKQKVKQGEELGYFNFGGSTIVTIIPEDVKINKVLTKNSKKNIETYMKIGDDVTI